jgi:peroxiredoxin Q/BCP
MPKVLSRPLADGEKAPDFTLPDQDGNPVNLYELLKNGPVVVFFYPKAHTAVCTAEACAFRDNFEIFSQAGAQIVGISGDNQEKQKSFHSKYQLTFPVLSDEDHSTYAAYGLRSGGGLKFAWALNDRVTFVIDRDGYVRHHSSGMFEADGHVEDSLKTVQALS